MFDEESYGEDVGELLEAFEAGWNRYKEQKEYADRLKFGRMDLEQQLNNIEEKETEEPDELYIGKCKSALQELIRCQNARIEAVDRQNLMRHDYLKMLGEDIFNLNKAAFRKIGPWYRDQIEKDPEELKNLEYPIMKGPEEINRLHTMMEEVEEDLSVLRERFKNLRMRYNRVRNRGGLDL